MLDGAVFYLVVIGHVTCLLRRDAGLAVLWVPTPQNQNKLTTLKESYGIKQKVKNNQKQRESLIFINFSSESILFTGRIY